MKLISLPTRQAPTPQVQTPQALPQQGSEHQARSRWSKIGRWIYDTFVLTNEPKIKLQRDRQGLTYWQVYDPVNRTHISLATESEVRIWLEKRYYR